MKILLPNGCSASQLKVFPNNWGSKKGNCGLKWYIIYRFYDPRYSKPKQVMLKGMNLFKTISERQHATQKLLSDELDALNNGFNPFDKHIDSLSSTLNFIEALNIALSKVTVAERTKKDLIRSIKALRS